MKVLVSHVLLIYALQQSRRNLFLNVYLKMQCFPFQSKYDDKKLEEAGKKPARKKFFANKIERLQFYGLGKWLKIQKR